MNWKKATGLGLATIVGVSLLATACAAPATSTPTSAPTKPAAAPTGAAPAATKAPSAPAATTAPATQPAATKPVATAPAKTSFPEKGKAITFIVPYPAGGATDIGGRLLCASMEKELGVPIQVVNKGGAGSQTGLTELAGAKPDGYTIGFANIPTAILIYMDPERKASFNGKSFVPIGVHVLDPSAIGVAANSPFKTLKDLVDAGKAKPDTIRFGSDGPMTDDHLGIYLLEKSSGAKFVNVGFDGGAQVLTAVLGGHIEASFGHVGDFVSQVKSGNIRVLSVLDNEKSKFFPDVPTMKEAGYDAINSSARTVVAPAGTPKEIVDTLSAAMKKAMQDPEQVKKLEDSGLTLRYMDAAQSSSFWAELETKSKVLVDQVRAEQKTK